MPDFKIVRNIILAAFLLAAWGCKDDLKEDVVPDPDPKEEEPIRTGDKEVLVWIEARANIFSPYGRFNDKEQISQTLDSVKSIGITGLVVDVKGSSGYTNYPSSIARQLTSLEGESLPEGMDYLAHMVEEVDSDKQDKLFPGQIYYIPIPQAEIANNPAVEQIQGW